MSLAEAVSEYLISDKNQNQEWTMNHDKVVDRLKKSSTTQMQYEYNAIADQYLWTQVLEDIFYSEMLNRVNSLTFVISWEWDENKPEVYWQIGFRNEYTLVNQNMNYITNEKIEETVLLHLIHLILTNTGEVYAEVNDKKIISINTNKLRVMIEKSEEEGRQMSVIIMEDEEFNIIKKMLKELMNRTYGVVDF